MALGRWTGRVWLLGLMVAAGCASGAPVERSSGRLEGGLLGLEDERVGWMGWEARPVEKMWPLGLRDDAEVVVFEAWDVVDPVFREQVWDVVFHGLWPLRDRQGASPAAEAVQMALMVLDPLNETTRFELSFFMRADGGREGVVLRIFSMKEVGPGVWVEASGVPGEGVSEWRVRVEPAVEESAGLAMLWRKDGASWEGMGAADAQAEPADAAAWAQPENRVVAALQQVLWEQVTGAAFVSPEFDHHQSSVWEASEAERVGLWPARHGGEWRERQLDEYPARSVFWPRGMPGSFE
ncbi:hypothetical protein EA187_07415 [Lujinxingia sediminis]|uniref:Uncharacterized protein n=1 Tax=Lujinxingia sediminis TaxID=2480984 RepID=A0ABY0CV99_9DELT|nr:hypothetical protein [Lujinxingia sediminis]RVU46956.1 hypothetical protein EA187_07415 [Lujinxingia sediminis]